MGDVTQLIIDKQPILDRMDRVYKFNEGFEDDDEVNRLSMGSTLMRWLHQKFDGSFVASDIDLVLVDTKCDNDIVAFIEYKHEKESLSWAQLKVYNRLARDGHEIYIIIGNKTGGYTYGYRIHKYVPGVRASSGSGLPVSYLPIVLNNLLLHELEDWERNLREEHCRR